MSMSLQAAGKGVGVFRVLHSADWHLGKMLGEHSREKEHERFLAFLLNAIERHEVDALVVAGDVFDSANPPQSAMAQYYDFLCALSQNRNCASVIVAGNHDSPALLEAPRQVLRALRTHVIGGFSENAANSLIAFPNTKEPCLVIAAVPFLRDRDLRTGQLGQTAPEIQRALVEGIRRRYDEVAEATRQFVSNGIPVLATGHLTILGSKASESEREIHVGGLGAIGADTFAEKFSYVALGHLHSAQGARDNVRYAGSPIPLSFSESGNKSLEMLDFAGGKLVSRITLDIPLSRQLLRLELKRQDFEGKLHGVTLAETDLPAWVEVVVEDAVAGENLYERAQEIAQGKNFEVIRVIGNRNTVGPGHPAPLNPEGVANILAEPMDVFEYRLKQEPGLTDAEREGLRTAFRELLELHAEEKRGL
jgi:DNA repair protein SbcD/Mre11